MGSRALAAEQVNRCGHKKAYAKQDQGGVRHMLLLLGLLYSYQAMGKIRLITINVPFELETGDIKDS